MENSGEERWSWCVRADIDTARWDAVIRQSATPLLYADSAWLDAMTGAMWGAWIWGDYNAVFPTFAKRKWGVPYITQPVLCQRFALMGGHSDARLMTELVPLLLRKNWKIDLMSEVLLPPPFTCEVRVNHILAIEGAYSSVCSGYHRNTGRNIEKAKNTGVKIHHEELPEGIVPFLVANDPTGLLSVWQTNILAAMTAFHSRGGAAWSARRDGELLAAAYCVCYGDRVYFLLCQSSPVGKQTAAMYLLIDQMLQHYVGGAYKWFDFTGSTLPSIARRNLGFGAVEETYWHVKWRRLGGA